jgi:four helix bundle suffix protein
MTGERNSWEKGPGILRRAANWKNLRFYRKSDVLYQLTVAFCRRFFPAKGNRTVDQMVQAARSGKQNIVEGCEAGVTSAETELKLLNVARASLQELREDYADYLKEHGLERWEAGHPLYEGLLAFCRERNDLADYEPLFEKAGAEELANLALTLCHMTDRMMSHYLARKEAAFTEEGGIRERMTAARLGRRQSQNEEIAALKEENQQLRKQLKRALEQLERLEQLGDGGQFRTRDENEEQT